MDHWNNFENDDFLEFQKKPSTNHMVSSPIISYPDNDSLQQLKIGFAKMMSTMERLEQRLNSVEQTTSQILKNQQETLQVPFMSQSEIDRARKVAEQLEQDTNVAKQLQAAFNKEIEVKKIMSTPQLNNIVTQTTTTRVVPQQNRIISSECPICGVRVNQSDLEVHVDNCLEMFSDDPRREVELKDAKKKMETGFFSKFLKRTTSKTETTKIVTETESANVPLLTYSHENDGIMNSGYYPPYSYPQYPSIQNGQIQNQPIMMPMYMYPPNH